MDEFISVQDLSFTYKSWTASQNAPILRNVSFQLPRGSKTLLLAPFDAGKSTLARILSGLCPRYLGGSLDGRILVGGVDVQKTEPWNLVEKCGYVSQNPLEQFISSSVQDELAFPLESLGVTEKAMHERLGEALCQWDLEQLREVPENQLSGGERKRVLLALNQMVDPDFWILDESFDDLDQHWRVYLSERIRQSDKTILVLASRYLVHFEGLFDQYALLQEGKVVFAPLEQVKERFSTLSGDDVLTILPRSPALKNRQVLSTEALKLEKTRPGDISRKAFTLSVPHFSLASGEMKSLIGPNGCGKSTFSRLACGLDTPSDGFFFLNGRKASTKELNSSVGYLFQNPDLQIFLPTVRDELSWSLSRDRRLRKDEIERKVDQCASLFGLALEDTPTTMSYPRRKALQAAVYYLLDRPFYILDELDNALTYAKAQQIVRLLSENGSGILLITHDQKFASLVTQEGYSIQNGRMQTV